MKNQNEEHPHVSMLRAIYADLTHIAVYSDDGVVLHPANRGSRT